MIIMKLLENVPAIFNLIVGHEKKKNQFVGKKSGLVNTALIMIFHSAVLGVSDMRPI